MKIIVNGAVRDITGATVEAALAEIGFAGAVVATAHNGEFLPVTARPRTLLSEGDRLEVLAPTQGG